jgi:hypothetical protein
MLAPTLTFGQDGDWRIRGALAALKDTDDQVVEKAFEKLYKLNVLDSLIRVKAISKKGLDYCRKPENWYNADGILLFALTCQDPLPPSDLTIIKSYLLDGKEYTSIDQKIIDLTKRKNVPSGLLKIYREIWPTADLDTKASILVAMTKQDKMPTSDSTRLKDFLTMPFSKYKAAFMRQPQRRSMRTFYDLYGLRKEPVEDANGNFNYNQNRIIEALVEMDPLTEERINFLHSLVATGDKQIKETIFYAIRDMDNFDKGILPLYKQLFPQLGQRKKTQYLTYLVRSTLLNNGDINEIRDYLVNSEDCYYEYVLEYPLENQHAREQLPYLLVAYIRNSKCSKRVGWIAAKSDSSIINNPAVSEEVKNVKPDNDEIKAGVVHFLARQKKLLPKDRKLILDYINNSTEDCRRLIVDRCTGKDIHPEVLEIFRGMQDNASPSMIWEIAGALLAQKRYPDKDLEYFSKLIADTTNIVPGMRRYEWILGELARQQPMQSEVTSLLLDNRPDTLYNSFFDAFINRADIPEQFWPYIIKDATGQGSFFAEFLKEYQGIVPEQFYLVIINSIDRVNKYEIDDLRFASYYFGGGNPIASFLFKCMANPDKNMKWSEKKGMFLIIDSIWNKMEGCDKLKLDLATTINKIVVPLNNDELREVKDILLNFLERFRSESERLGNHAALLKEKISEVTSIENRVKNFLLQWCYLLIIHPVCWLLLIFLYPNNTKVQSFFFWNKNIRKWGGLGYVNLLLIHVPFLRNRILSPFKKHLVEDAAQEAFDPEFYFPNSQLVDTKSNKNITIDDLALYHNQVIIWGESGLGKTMILCHLLHKTRKLSVFLKAEHCKQGVEQAIRNKMAGMAEDRHFIKSMLYNGYMDVYIDGINEVGPDTRVSIGNFIRHFPKCTCFITTQPIAWDMPANAAIIHLLPLARKFIAAFLHSRFKMFPWQEPVSEEAYKQMCDHYLDKNIGDEVSNEQRVRNQKILSNPHDLTIVGQLILHATGKSLDLYNLQQEYYDQMTAKYQNIHPHKEGFPLAGFSEKIYALRLRDESRIPYSAYHDEIDCMQKFRMVICRVLEGGAKEWFFRHDKIKDFFILQTFLKTEDRQEKYIPDSRFRGVYFMLATSLPLEDAQKLERKIINYAVDNNDYSLCNEFIKLLRDRTDAEA